ncbi:MAG: hypothetical protein JEY71_07660 [Sphaerochaeta sp.]|nr:hypothetical protein [Sphaerochaeta sp.]
MKKLILLFVLGIVCLNLIVAGPFGIDMGQSLETLEKNGLNPVLFSENSPGYYSVSPKYTHSEFETYLVRIDRDEGVFFIKGIGKDIQDSGYGVNTQSHFNDIRKAIDGTYGHSNLESYLFPSSIWDEPRDWMMAIRQDERVLLAIWEKSDGSFYPGDIESIYLAADATSSSIGYLAIDYYGKFYERLLEKSKQVAAEVF